MLRATTYGLLVTALTMCATRTVVAEAPLVEQYLLEGKLAAGERALQEHLREQPRDDEARFGLGTLQFLQAIEQLGQSLHEYGAVGAKTRVGQRLPLLRLGVPENPAPKKVAYEDVRRIVQRLVDDLAVAERTLADVKDKKVKLPLHMAKVRLDLNSDGAGDESESLWKIYAQLNRGANLPAEFTPQQAGAFVVGFDYADVLWLRGYCHLLSAMGETMLMYDEHEAFNVIAPQVFARPPAPAIPQELFREDQFIGDIADAIAAIHLMRFPVVEPKRGKMVLEHLHAVIDLSRQNWKTIEAETDDDNEWVPSAKQTSLIPNVRVTPEIIAGWHDFLDEAELLLAGKKLVPHWRLRADRGINLKRVFTEPREFDAVLWIHGAGAIPYLEEGDCTNRETWNRFNTVFGGQFIGFAFWFN